MEGYVLMKLILAVLAVVPVIIASSPSPCTPSDEYYEDYELIPTPAVESTPTPVATPYPLTEPTVTPPPAEMYARRDEARGRTTVAIRNGRAMHRGEAVRRALDLVVEVYGQEGLEGYLRGSVWGGVVDQREARRITQGIHSHPGGGDYRLVWVLIVEGPFVYQFQNPLRLYTAISYPPTATGNPPCTTWGRPPSRWTSGPWRTCGMSFHRG